MSLLNPCSASDTSLAQIKSSFLRASFLPRVFFHILGFGGKPHDKRSIFGHRRHAGDDIGGFYHLEDDFITLFFIFSSAICSGR